MTDPFRQLQQLLKDDITAFAFHTCMYNAPRKKTTAIWASVKQMAALCRQCDGSHEHKPWGLTENNTFATAEECAYNTELAEHWAATVSEFAEARGVLRQPSTLGETAFHPTMNNDYANRTVIGVQPRGNKLPPVMTDLLQPQQVDIGAFPDIKCLAPGNTAAFPPGSRLIRFVNDEVGRDEAKPWKAILGLPRTQEQYVEEACKLTHPMNMDARFSNELSKALEAQFVEDALELRKIRIQTSHSILKMIAELASDEKKLHDSSPKHIQRILKNKKVLLFKRLLEQVGYKN